MQGIYDDLEREAVGEIEKLGFKKEEILRHYTIDMRYSGQAHEVVMEIPPEMMQGKMDKSGIEKLEAMFHERHRSLFGHASPESGVEFITLSVAAIGPIEKEEMYEIEEGREDPEHAMKGIRQVYFEEFKGYGDCKTYDRYLLKANNLIQGPAILEQMDTTIVIPPGQKAVVDRFGNIIMEIIT